MKRDLNSIQVAAELSLVAVTLATVHAFSRLFSDGDYAGPLVAAAICSHLVAAATRRIGWGIGRAAAVSLVALTFIATWSLFGDTTALGVPSGETVEAFRVATDQAWTQFREVVAPTPTLAGFVLALVLGIWAGAFLADWAAFRLWSPIEAIVPMSALFVFAALLGEDDARTRSAVLFITAVTAFELLHRVAHRAREGRWVNNDVDRGINALVIRGALLGLGAVAVGSIVAPALPMADDPAVLDWRGAGDGDSQRVVSSPLVTIEKRLVEQTDIELFTVQSEDPAYWRLTSLDIFDGQIWRSDGTFEKASGTLPRTNPAKPDGDSISQTYSIGALSSPWLPAVFEPLSFSSESTEAVYEPDSSTLIVPHDRDDSNGADYLIESIRPTFDPEVLRNSGGTISDDIAEKFLQLPGDFSRPATEQAEVVTGPGATDYDKALLLQNWFRSEFEYDLDVDLDHDIGAMEAFLQERRGYCQQFAGTYAAMARSLGIPSRVAVGFTWGERDAVDPTLWHVSGRQAHAWVEVYIAGTGWVDFDPTPGRGAPGSGAWTQNDAEQDVTEREAATDTTPTTPIEADPDTERPAEVDPAETPDVGETTGEGSSEMPESRTLPVTLMVMGVLLAAGFVVGGTTALINLRRRRARRHLVEDLIEQAQADQHSAADRGESTRTAPTDVDTRAGIQAAWEEMVDRLGVFGVEELPAETQSQFVDRAASVTDIDPAAPQRLAEGVDEADFALSPPTAAALDDARTTMSVVEEHVVEATTRWDRFLHLVDPRPLLSNSRKRSR